MVITANTQMTAEEFFALPETVLPTELIEGQLIVSPAPSTQHQRVHRRLLRVLEAVINSGEIFYAPTDVRLSPQTTTQPDLLWIAPESRAQVTDSKIEGAPDLVIEIFSPGSVTRDKIDKHKLYEQYGVREYWMVDPVEGYLEVHVRVEDRFALQGTYANNASFDSPVIGKAISLANIFD